MKYLLTSFIVLTLALSKGYAQFNDSTSQFKCAPLETIKITRQTMSEDDLVIDENSAISERSSFSIFDPELKHCLIKCKLIEYKDGEMTRDTVVVSPGNHYSKRQLATFEDSTLSFALYRQLQKSGHFLWGFRTQTALVVKEIVLSNPDSYVVFLVDPQQKKLPVGKPFVFLAITFPDDTGNFPFCREENKNKFRPYDWNKNFKLKHTFLIELTIERSNEAEEGRSKLTTLNQ